MQQRACLTWCLGRQKVRCRFGLGGLWVLMCREAWERCKQYRETCDIGKRWKTLVFCQHASPCTRFPRGHMGEIIGTHVGGIGGAPAPAPQGDNTWATERAAQVGDGGATAAVDTTAALDFGVCGVEQGWGGYTNHTNEHAPVTTCDVGNSYFFCKLSLIVIVSPTLL